MTNEKLKQIKKIIDDYKKDMQKAVDRGFSPTNADYDKFLWELRQVDGLRASFLINLTEKEFGKNYYLFIGEKRCERYMSPSLRKYYEFKKAQEAENLETSKLWGKVFAYEVKNETNEHGVEIDYKKAREVVIGGSFVVGESREKALRYILGCNEEVSKKIVSKYDSDLAEEFILRNYAKIAKATEGCQSVDEVVDKIVELGLEDSAPVNATRLAQAFVLLEAQEVLKEIEKFSAEDEVEME